MKKFHVYTKSDPTDSYTVQADDWCFTLATPDGPPILEFHNTEDGKDLTVAFFLLDNVDGMIDPELVEPTP